MELSTVFTSDTLKAADLQGHEPVVIIESVEMKEYENGNKLLLTFKGKQKGLVCNKTNANRIAHYYGTNTDAWIGKELTLYTDLVDFQGKTVEAIRVRVKAPPKPVARPSSAEMKPRQSSNDEFGDEVPF